MLLVTLRTSGHGLIVPVVMGSSLSTQVMADEHQLGGYAGSGPVQIMTS